MKEKCGDPQIGNCYTRNALDRDAGIAYCNEITQKAVRLGLDHKLVFRFVIAAVVADVARFVVAEHEVKVA